MDTEPARAVEAVREYQRNTGGTEHYYRHWTKRLVYTDGVQFVAETCGAHWLIDLVASYQAKPFYLQQEFQVWELLAVATEDGQETDACVVRMHNGQGGGGMPQSIPYTDFPRELLPFRLYLERGSLDGANPCLVLMLPEER